MNTMFNGMFMKVQKGLCMLSPCGIAIKTSSGYRSYDTRSGKLRNCDNLVFSFGDGLFFVIPSAKVKPGDIILNGGKPACVRKAGRDSIEVINYETSAVETILPERHVFMGNTWFYGKIVSLFGDGSSDRIPFRRRFLHLRQRRPHQDDEAYDDEQPLRQCRCIGGRYNGSSRHGKYERAHAPSAPEGRRIRRSVRRPV